MLIDVNKKELEQLAKYFYNITKTLISIYDADMHPICSYPNTMCEFCTKIGSVADFDEQCIRDDNNAFEMCKKTRDTYIYTCHMGLVEVATPIIYDNLIVGYMLFGQISDQRDKSNVYDRIRQIPDAYGFDKPELMRAADKIRYRSKEYIESISALVEMCANYIWLNNIISVRREGLAHNISMYITRHLSYDLSVQAICNKFHISSGKLYEFSQKHFGCGICEYIQRCRLDKAKELLCEPDRSVSEIAELVGFKDVNYFIRFFKKSTGTTPKKYQFHQASKNNQPK